MIMILEEDFHVFSKSDRVLENLIEYYKRIRFDFLHKINTKYKFRKHDTQFTKLKSSSKMK